MRTKNFIYLLSCCALLLASCTKDDTSNDGNEEVSINPTNANAISRVLIFPTGSESQIGTPPSPTLDLAPVIEIENSSILSSNGSTAPIDLSYSGATSDISGIYIQVTGSSSFTKIPIYSATGASGNLQIPVGIPTNVMEGEFCVNIWVYDSDNNVSNAAYACITVLRLGTGSVQISLSWDTETDQDLHVIEPNGTEIYWLNTLTETGGTLDRDDMDGFGPENIYWENNAPDGVYQVKVKDYNNTTSPTSYYITVSGPNTSKNFSGTISDGLTIDVVTFTKTGSYIMFN